MELDQSNNINYFTMGEGRPLYLIHGFPDCAENFELQLNYFSKKGFQVIAPFLPGYHENDVELDTYQTLRIAEVLIEFIESISDKDKIYLYGHDWGAPIANGIAHLKPNLIEKFSTASVPHGVNFQSALLTDGEQQRMSWYMFFFQLPLADISVPMNDFEFIHRLWREWSPDLHDYKHYSNRVVSVLKKPNVLNKALLYYRSAFQDSLQTDRINSEAINLLSSKIQPPCMYFHGKNDGCIDYKLSTGMENFFEKIQINILDGCGHFLHLEKPDEFNEMLLDFFTDS